MKRSLWFAFFSALGFLACSQPPKTKNTALPVSDQTLLWKISGKDLSRPSYLFGTMHMICADDIEISDSLRSAIKSSDRVYLELDMDDMMQMLGAMSKMTMRDDTTLADLLTKDEYQKVKNYFEEKGGMIPFAMVEKFKPMLVESMMMEQSFPCDNMIVMEQLVMQEAKQNGKDVKGLETMDYQLSIFDTIPYSLQARQLVKMVSDTAKGNEGAEMKVLTDAYRNQQLNKLDELTRQEDMGIQNFTDLLLYNRNANWTRKLQTLMSKQSLVVAVGAGHLPGEKGVINLLRKAGYKVEPVRNDMIKKKVKEI